MALSDTCYDALNDLGNGFKRYCHWYDNTEYCSGIIDAMFDLAAVAVKIDMNDPFVSRDFNLTVSRVVLISLLLDEDDPNSAQREAIYKSLVEVACMNSRFARALETIESWLDTMDGKATVASAFPEFGIVPSILEMARWSTTGLAA